MTSSVGVAANPDTRSAIHGGPRSLARKRGEPDALFHWYGRALCAFASD